MEGRTLLSSTWYVSPSGNDANAGTLAAPFQTIQHAASLAGSGDTVSIRGGTYRETVKPGHGGITFRNYNGESVTVSGADQLGGWGGYNGSIYQAPMSWDLGEGNNQVFVNGQMVNEARWPNTGTDLSHPTLASVDSGGGGGNSVTIRDAQLSAGWTGANIHIMPGSGWYAQTGTVVASGQGWLTFNYTHDMSWTEPRGGNLYYLYGKFQALDGAGEWYRDNSGKLYLWAPNGGNPASQNVEVKHRAYAFDLSGQSNVTIDGINIFAATIKTDGGSANTVINHMRATYISQFMWTRIGWEQPDNSGIQLNGDNSILENSTIAWSAGDGVYIRGANVRVTQTVIHDVDYNAADSAAIHLFGKNASIDHNLIYNAGRCGIIDQAWGAQIIGNTIHDVMLQTSDGAGIYTVAQNGAGSQIAWNTIYSIHEHVPNMSPTYFSANGIFLDNSASNWLIQNNTIADVDAGVKMNFWSTGNQVLNNQLAGNVGSIMGNGDTGSWSGGVITGNTLYSDITFLNPGAKIYNNPRVGGSPKIGGGSVPPPDPVQTPSASGGGSNSGSSNSGGSSGKTNSGTTSGGGNTTGSAAKPIIGPVRPKVTAPTSAINLIAAGASSSSLGTQPLADGSVEAAAGDWLRYAAIDFGKGMKSLAIQLGASGTQAGLKIQLRLDGVTGPVIGTIRPTGGGKGKTAHVQSAHVRKVTGVHDLYLVFVGHKGQVGVQSFSFKALPSK